MTPDQMTLLTAILTTVLGGGGLGAYVLYRAQKKKEPIDAETAAVVNARTAGELALALAKQQDGSINVLREDLRVVRTDLDATRAELAAVRATLGGITNWIRDLFARWDEHRQHPHPPGGLPPGVL